MHWLRRGALGIGVIAGIALVGAGATFLWARAKRNDLLGEKWAVHDSTIPVPFPLSPAELDALRAASPPADGADPLAGVDLGAIALERAIARGGHQVRARGACVTCHGEDLGGGTMLDEPMVMRIFGPNLTSGPGSVTTGFTPQDWERAIRHGVRRDGTTTLMPGIEIFHTWSDREVSDVIAYIASLPPVDRTVEPSELGPIGTFMYARGGMEFGALAVRDHQAGHAKEPPAELPNEAFGEHLAHMCVGCHGSDFRGGPAPHGDPSWGPAADLTSGGLQGWTVEDFQRLLHEGKRPDGTDARPPMNELISTTKHFSEVEVQALWAYFRSLPAAPAAL